MRRTAALALALAGCGDDPDPCAGVTGACLAIHVESSTVDAIDQLELDVLYGDRHAYATTVPAGGGAVSLPLATAIALAPAAGEVLPVGVVAAGKLGATVAGTGAASTTLAFDQRASITIDLSPIGGCQDGGLYCGGDQLAGDPATLYLCDRDGVPKARGRCTAGCIVNATTDDTCRAADDGQPGPCTEGGFYCGGDELEGDPQALYRCQADGTGVRTMVCADGCVIGDGVDDHCR